MLLFAVFLFYMLLVFGYFALANMGKSVMLVVLTIVKTYVFAVFGNTHWNELVDKPIAKITDYERIYNDNGDGKQMIEKYDKSFFGTGN